MPEESRWNYQSAASEFVYLFICLFFEDKIGLACYAPVPLLESLTQTCLLVTPASWGQLALTSASTPYITLNQNCQCQYPKIRMVLIT